MDALDEICLRMKISKLEARIELRGIEIAALSREVNARSASMESMSQARERLHTAQNEETNLRKELAEIRKAAPTIHH